MNSNAGRPQGSPSPIHTTRVPTHGVGNITGATCMGFIMDGLDAEAYDRNYSDRQLIARIIGYFRPKLRIMLIVAALIVLTSLLDTVFPILISYGINLVVASPTGQVILLLIGAILLSGIFSWLCNF